MCAGKEVFHVAGLLVERGLDGLEFAACIGQGAVCLFELAGQLGGACLGLFGGGALGVEICLGANQLRLRGGGVGCLTGGTRLERGKLV